MAAPRGADDPSVDGALFDESAEDLYENAPAGYLSTLPSGLVVKANQTLLTWTGYGREELVGTKRLHDLLAPGARIYYETHYAPLLQMQGSVREVAVELIRADGTRLPVLLNSTLVRDDDGTPRVIRTTVFDASDRRRYERELLRARADAESRARAALALAHVHDGVLLVTPSGRVEVINDAAVRILGVDASDVLGRPVADVVSDWSGVATQAPIVDAGAATVPAVVPLSAGEHERWVAVAAVDAGEGGIVYTFRDVTDEQALEQLRGDVVAVVSHELRTPLTGVYGSAQTLLARYDDLDDATRRQLLQLVVDQAERLTRIVDEIQLTSRLDAGDIDAPDGGADATAIADTLRASLPPDEQTRVRVEGAPDARVRGHEAQVRQILSNLVDNALKYSAGDVVVRVVAAESTVRLTVSDEGSGVPPAEHERIFERFYRLDPDQQRGVGGVGLGLYIARRLTEHLGGTIGVVPVARGTTVSVELPTAGVPGSAPAAL